jgi:hypothetical protein
MTTTSKPSLASFFERRTRDSAGDRAAEVFYTLKDDAPEWLRDAIYEAHGGTLPDDWVYAECLAAIEEFDEGRFDGTYPEDAIHEHADGRVDIYTKELFGWAEEFCLTDIYSEAEAEAEDLLSAEADTHDRLATIQYCAIARIVRTMIDAARENADETADEEEAS